MTHIANLLHDLRGELLVRLLDNGVPAILLADLDDLHTIVYGIQYGLKEGNLAEVRHYYSNGWIGFLQDVNEQAEALWW